MTDEGLSTDSAACFMTGDTAGSAARYLPPYFCRLLPERVHFESHHLKPYKSTENQHLDLTKTWWKILNDSSWHLDDISWNVGRGCGGSGVVLFFLWTAVVRFCTHDPDHGNILLTQSWLPTPAHGMMDCNRLSCDVCRCFMFQYWCHQLAADEC